MGKNEGSTANNELDPPLDHHQKIVARNVKTIARLEKAIMDRRWWDDRIIDSISWIFGHKGFAYFNALAFVLWIGVNCGWLGLRPFDPYPFQFLTLIVSLEAIFLSIFILITQNRSSLMSERRSHIELQLTLLNEQETTAQMKLLLKMAEHMGVDVEALPEEMLHQVDMRQLVVELDAALKRVSAQNA